MSEQAPFQLKDFTGWVVLQDWAATPDGQSFNIFAGRCSIYSAKEATGFDLVTERNANWLVRVEGPSGEAWNFPGCQVRAVVAGELRGAGANVCRVP